MLEHVHLYNYIPNARINFCFFYLQSNGWTALHFAAKIGQIKIVQLLLQHGVDAMILDLVRTICI